MYILSQIFIVMSDSFCIASMLSKKKKSIELFLIISTILFGAHYVCLSAWTGAAIALIELAYLISMYVLEIKNKTKYNVVLSVATMIATVILSVLTWNTWISVLPMVGMLIYLAGLIFSNVIIVKACTFIRLAINGIYMLLLGSYFGAGLTIVILIFSIIGIINDYKNKKRLSNK